MASTAAKAETKAPAATKPAKPAAPAVSKPTAPAASKPAAPAASKPAAPAANKPAAKSTGKVEKKRAGRPRNYNLGNGIYRFSRTRMYHKKAVYKFIGKKTPPAPKPKRPIFVEKPIGGEKNGGKRIVLIKKRRNYYPTQDKIKKRHPRGFFRKHKRHLRSTLTPGTIAILLAGPHKGKRVVVLKQLSSGLLLVTGPFLINACPMRRINQIYVIGTATKINMTDVKLPEHIDDKYFKRQKKKRAKKEEGDIFAKKKERYRPSEQRKSDQKIVDKMVISAIKKHPDRKVLFAYLSAMFGLRSSQYPHRMKF